MSDHCIGANICWRQLTERVCHENSASKWTVEISTRIVVTELFPQNVVKIFVFTALKINVRLIVQNLLWHMPNMDLQIMCLKILLTTKI